MDDAKSLHGLSLADLKARILARLQADIGKEPEIAQADDWLVASIMATREAVTQRWLESSRASYADGSKRVYYMSMEFLIGRMLRDALQNLGMLGILQQALSELGADFDLVAALEPDAALGNGGLGRLAACFMDSMASLDIPAHGYGIRYRHGLFKQSIKNGEQVEHPETWLEEGNPWELPRPRRKFEVGFGGHVNGQGDPRLPAKWAPHEVLVAAAHDTPICGWQGARVNTLRLWQARPQNPIDFALFNAGDHVGAQAGAARADAINRVLYPADANPAGQELRLRQQFFFVSASLQDILRRHLHMCPSVENLHEKAAIQLNDTHPSIAIVELMRLLVDVHGIAWAKAWEITRKTCSYTNHTLLPEALESWHVGLMEYLLPRHMQIIYAINANVIEEAHKLKSTRPDFLRDVSLIDENNGKRVRMGQLAFAGSHSINGVSGLHSDLMKETVFGALNELYPGRINNKTNGVTPRRWVQQVNPGLARLVQDAIGPQFENDHSEIKLLENSAKDAAFGEAFTKVKHANKIRLAKVIADRTAISVDPSAIFDVQIKRIHEYKRQLLGILEAIALYQDIKANPNGNFVPRVKIFAGKAAASYWDAKLIIRLINDVGAIVNTDPAVRDRLKVVFIPNYNVSLAETVVPAANISEQISTAGMEASGTGNMKLSMNGALTVGTLDGANVEISEHVGLENIFIFGLTAAEVAAKRKAGYNPDEAISKSARLKAAIDGIATGLFSPSEPHRYSSLADKLRHSDWFLVTADFDAYCGALKRAEALWQSPAKWTETSILNVARMGWFSSDRTIREYARDIWGINRQ
jgi:glycogen phosphorylase